MVCFINKAYCQQDIDFHLNGTFLAGKNILKVKRDFHDPYLWVLAQNNGVYRINSITKVVDDYTGLFSAYSGLKFIDIAGPSLDTVFIATNSTNLIEYKKGILKIIGTGEGIAGVINSIGIDGVGAQNYFTTENNLAMIATSNGICRYNYRSETMLPIPANDSSRIYEATYRNEMLSDGQYNKFNVDTVDHFPAIELVNFTIYVGDLWFGGNSFGNHIKSAFYTNGDAYYYGDQFVIYANQLWATENGLFQNYWLNSSSSTSGYQHYLSGVNINKITSIYGLLSFGEPLVRENILIGSAQGLYFTNSKYRIPTASLYSIFHYNGLGNKPINDICVNATSYTTPICEDGVWVAATDGLYLLKPDYSSYADTGKKISGIQFGGQTDTVSTSNICINTSVTAIVNPGINPGNILQWYKNGQELPNESNPELIITTPGDYYALFYDPCSDVHFQSNHLKVNITAAPVFAFNYPDKTQQCSTDAYTLKIDNNPGYHYRWYTNGTLNGDTTSNYIVTQTGKYKIEVSSCAGNWVASKEVEVDLISLPLFQIKGDKAVYCANDTAILSINLSTDSSYTIYWYRNNVLLPGYTNHTSVATNTPGSYAVTINSNSTNSDGTICSQTSPVQLLTFNPPLTLTIQKVDKTTLCEGQTVDLIAHYNQGTIKWSTGETTDKITVNNTGNYAVTATSSSGCIADTSIAVTFFPNPVFNIKDTSICTYKNQPITLTAPAGFIQYTWNGQNGDQTYLVSQPQTVILMVTDANGCQATQNISVLDRCPNIFIPNTFTPNGDGINDSWIIEGLDNDPSVLVNVFTRYGTKVFESKGYGIPWNGQYQGKRLPAGTYYYIVTAKKGTQKLSGSLTIIY